MGHARAVEPLAHRRGHVDTEVSHHELLKVGERLASGGREVGERSAGDAVTAALSLDEGGIEDARAQRRRANRHGGEEGFVAVGERRPPRGGGRRGAEYIPGGGGGAGAGVRAAPPAGRAPASAPSAAPTADG